MGRATQITEHAHKTDHDLYNVQGKGPEFGGPYSPVPSEKRIKTFEITDKLICYLMFVYN